MCERRILDFSACIQAPVICPRFLGPPYGQGLVRSGDLISLKTSTSTWQQGERLRDGGIAAISETQRESFRIRALSLVQNSIEFRFQGEQKQPVHDSRISQNTHTSVYYEGFRSKRKRNLLLLHKPTKKARCMPK